MSAKQTTPSRRNALEPVDAIPEVLANRPKPPPKRDRSWDQNRTKATYDLPSELIERIKEITREIGADYPNTKIRVGDVARLLLEAGLEQYEAGKIKIELHPSEFRLFSR